MTKTYKSRAAASKAARKEWKRIMNDKAARGSYVGVQANYNDPNLGASGPVKYGQADVDKERGRAQRQADKDAGKGTNNAFDHSADNLKTLRHVYASKDNAKRSARAEWRRLQRGMATLSLTLARGRPDLFPELPVVVTGFKPSIDSTDWVITRATHTMGEEGYTTALELEIKATEVPG
ncbi:conserved hypothetical protein [Gammaproteobacteria bacterium]